jgi:hypothetical protein
MFMARLRGKNWLDKIHNEKLDGSLLLKTPYQTLMIFIRARELRSANMTGLSWL